ncbi:hypothetical protein Q9966_012193 [Columba livia]|nr:hypothetical protein Q9966_012193 [Columba livia]
MAKTFDKSSVCPNSLRSPGVTSHVVDEESVWVMGASVLGQAPWSPYDGELLILLLTYQTTFTPASLLVAHLASTTVKWSDQLSTLLDISSWQKMDQGILHGDLNAISILGFPPLEHDST